MQTASINPLQLKRPAGLTYSKLPAVISPQLPSHLFIESGYRCSIPQNDGRNRIQNGYIFLISIMLRWINIFSMFSMRLVLQNYAAQVAKMQEKTLKLWQSTFLKKHTSAKEQVTEPSLLSALLKWPHITLEFYHASNCEHIKMTIKWMHYLDKKIKIKTFQASQRPETLIENFTVLEANVFSQTTTKNIQSGESITKTLRWACDGHIIPLKWAARRAKTTCLSNLLPTRNGEKEAFGDNLPFFGRYKESQSWKTLRIAVQY